MKIGEKAQLVITSQYGYGDEGSGEKIPGKATLIFDVELVATKVAKKKRWEMSDEEKLEEATKLKNEGNVHFKS
jgi:peptidylprolyl isomerase